MNFGNPHAFWLLLFVVVLAAVDALKQGSIAARWPKVGRLWAGRHEIDLNKPGIAPGPRWFFWSGLALLVIALAQPRYGQADLPAEEQPREVMIALDLSRSMLARDVKPSRLDHAKLLLQGLLDKLAGEHAGLVLFSGSSYLQIPLSADYEILTGFLPSLSPEYFPQGGTNFESMLKTSLESYSQAEGVERFLLVLSDGEAFDEKWKPLADQLKARGVRVIGIGIGTAAGAVIPGPNNSSIKDATGREVVTRLKPGTLQDLAKATEGRYLQATAWVNISDVLKEMISTEKKELARKKDQNVLVERYRWALVPALAFLFLSFWRELPVRPRNRIMHMSKTSASVTSALAVFLLLAGLQLSSSRAQAQGAPIMRGGDQAEAEDVMPDPDRPTPMMRLGGMVSKRIEEMLKKPEASSDDYVALAIDMMAYMENMLKARQRFPVSASNDTFKAIELGEKLDPQGGNWTQLRAELTTMSKANLQPWGTANPDAAGKSDLSTGFDPENDMKVSSKGGGGIASDPAAQQALAAVKQKFDAASAFGEMAGEKKQSALNEDDGPSVSSDVQVVGGQKTEAEQEIEQHPELVLPLQRLAHVRDEDTPAKLFQMLDGNKNYLVPEGPDW